MLNALAAERTPEAAVLAGLTDAAKAAVVAGADTPNLHDRTVVHLRCGGRPSDR